MPASILLTLDTRPPTLTIEAPESVSPPDDLVVRIGSSEPIGLASVALIDALGTLTNLGVHRTSDRTAVVSIPSLGLASGPATVRISVADEVLNVTEHRLVVRIDRPRAFDAVLTVQNGHEVDLALDEGYGAVLEVHNAHQTYLEVS